MEMGTSVLWSTDTPNPPGKGQGPRHPVRGDAVLLTGRTYHVPTIKTKLNVVVCLVKHLL